MAQASLGRKQKLSTLSAQGHAPKRCAIAAGRSRKGTAKSPPSSPTGSPVRSEAISPSSSAVRSCCRRTANAAATCGAAIEVPLMLV